MALEYIRAANRPIPTMKTMLSNRSALKWAVVLLVTGAGCLSAAEGPMGKPATVAFPSPLWKWSDKPGKSVAFDQIVEVSRLGIFIDAGEIQGKVVYLDVSPGEKIAVDKWPERRALWIQMLFPGIAKEDVYEAKPDPKDPPLQSVITCKQGDKSYMVAFTPVGSVGAAPQSQMTCSVTVGDTAFFTNAKDLTDRKVSDEPRSRILKTLFEKE